MDTPRRIPMAPAALLLLALAGGIAAGQSLWSLSAGPAFMNHYDFTGLPVGPPFPGFPAPPPILPAFPPFPNGGNDVNRAAGTLWATDGFFVVNTTPAGAVIAAFPVPAAAGGPLTGLTVDPFTGLLWATTPVTYVSLTPAGIVLGVFPAPPPVAGPPLTGVAFDTYLPGGGLYLLNAAGAVALVPPGPGPVLAFLPPGAMAILPPPYTGIGFDTSIAAPGQLRVASGGAPLHLIVPLPLGVPPALPPIPAPVLGPPVGMGMDAQPLNLGVATPCPIGIGANAIGFAGGWSVVPNPGFAVTLTGAAPVSPWFLFVSPGVVPGGIPLPGGGGFLYLAPPFLLAAGATTPAGGATVPIPIPAGLPIGLTVYFQFASGCPAVPLGFVASDYLQVTVSGI